MQMHSRQLVSNTSLAAKLRKNSTNTTILVSNTSLAAKLRKNNTKKNQKPAHNS